MRNKILKLVLVMGALTSMTAWANGDLSSSSKSTANNSSLPTECERMFNTAAKLVSEAEKQPGTHTQVAKMKNQLSETKKQILEMDSALQQKSCTKGLTALNALQEKHQ